MMRFAKWLVPHRKEWVVKPMLGVLVAAMVALGTVAYAASTEPHEHDEGSMTPVLQTVLAAFLGGLVSAAFGAPALVYAVGRVVERLADHGRRLDSIEEWKDGHMRDHAK